MTRSSFLFCLLSLVALLASSGWVYAGAQALVLREYLGQTWKNKLLTYRFDAPDGACHLDSVTLTGADGKVIRIECTFGTDFVFLSDAPAQVAADGIAFDGAAGSVLHRHGVLILALGAAGKVLYGRDALACDQAASVRIGKETALVRLSETQTKGGKVTLTLQGKWALPKDAPCRLQADKEALTLVLPAGVTEATLNRIP